MIFSEITDHLFKKRGDRMSPEAKALLVKRGAETYQKITDYAQKNALVSESVNRGKITILFIHEPGYELDTALLDSATKVWQKFAPDIGSNCKPISYMLKDGESFTDVIKGEQVEEIIYGVHHLPIKEGPGQAVSLDLTAGHSLDYDQGHYQVLAMQASSMDQLVSRVTDIYGGTWGNASEK